MHTKHKPAQIFVAAIVIMTMALSGFNPSMVLAQEQDGIERHFNAESGKVSFIGPEDGRMASASKALGTFIRPQDPALALAKRFAPEFGVENPERDLAEMQISRSDEGRVTVRYQQTYEGIPVVGGELIVNTNEMGDLYSMNGEVSADLSLPTEPEVAPEQARDTALQALAKWYQGEPADFVTSEPELWIYDESLLQSSSRPVELVWRMEVTSANSSLPVSELVLVNAHRGGVSLHFNQVDTAWTSSNVVSKSPSPKLMISTAASKGADLGDSNSTVQSTRDFSPNLLGSTWYVATTGNDSNDCATTSTPCATINSAIDKAASGDAILIAEGTYFSNNPSGQARFQTYNKPLTLSGGWNDIFSSQSGISILDGRGDISTVLYISSNATIERLLMQNGNRGIYIEGSTNVLIKQSSVYGNSNWGIAQWGGNLIIENSTISGNLGAGIYRYSGTINIINSTITGNSSSGVSGNSISIQNSIVFGNNNSADDSSDCSGDITSLGNNIIGTTSGCGIVLQPSDFVGINPQISAFLGSGYHALYSNSPAIDAGNASACPASDQRGASRSEDVNCDIGAYEYTIPGSLTNLSIVSGDGQHVAPNLALPVPLKVVALDSQGSPVPNVNVTFTAPGSGAGGTFTDTVTNATSVLTDIGGIAITPIFTANNELGSYTVSASADGVASVHFNLANIAWFVTPSGNDANSCASPASPCATINGAMGKATASYTIMIAAGTYTGSGSEVVLIDKDITLSGGWDTNFTAQIGKSTIDGQEARRGISTDGTNVAIDRFTIQNGFHATKGGGLNKHGGTLTLSNSIVSGNRSRWTGGGINNSGTLIISNTTINNNSAGDSCCGGGGGGGGIENFSGTLTLNNSTISDNSIIGGYQGSGIYTGGTVILNNSTVSGNSGGTGDGINTFTGTILLNNSTISGNQSYGINNVAGTVTLQNTIVAGNGTQGDCYNHPSYSGTINSQGYNLFGNISGCALTLTTGDLVGTSSNPINPLLKPLQDNGGSTFTHALMLGSPAIDAGNPAIPGIDGDACLSIDQRGVARPINIRCDIGAYEGLVPWTPSALTNTYTAKNGTSLPGTFLCNQIDLNCTNNANPDADAAHRYAIGTYNLYASQHDRDSIDNNGMVIISTADYGSNYGNAFWNEEQMVYGDKYGHAMADDVVAHELTHGVTQYESNLFYYYQSGAINESFSDLWGEYYDQINGQGNDTTGVKWLIGEDVSGLGAMRSMSNPPTFGDPDKMSSVNYYEGAGDNGGVHTNSGVNNKAVYLMANGGTFNGKTVTTLGWEKTAAIYYEANTNLLASGADYSDLYYTLQQACTNLIGQKTITAMDCREVKDALDAVEMNGQPAPNFNTNAPLCPNAALPNITFADDLETGLSNWTFTNGTNIRWQYDSPYGQYAQSGSHFLYGDDYPGRIADARAQLASFVVPSNGFLHFSHAYDFETGYFVGNPTLYNFDGGVLEYSTNGGSTWVDAGALITYNGYKGTIFNGAGNPLSSRSAFVGTSHGYISTRVNLASLAGRTVTFRWRMGLDEMIAAWGWWVDNIEVYNCDSAVVISGDTGAAGTILSYEDGTAKMVTSQTDRSYLFQVPSGWSGTVTPSHACYTFSPASLTYNNVTTSQMAQNYTATIDPASGCSGVDVTVGAELQGQYGLLPFTSMREMYPGLNTGPMRISSTNGIDIISTQRVVWGAGYDELMGYPADKLTNEYLFPWYNNKAMRSQLRIGNTGSVAADVNVYIGGELQNPGGLAYTIPAGGSIRLEYTGLNDGPVRIVTDTVDATILATMRVIWGAGYDELMGYPADQLTNEYVFPWYNNKAMSSQLRIGNTGSVAADVNVYIGGELQNPGGLAYTIPVGGSLRLEYAGLNAGPVRIVTDTVGATILATMRVIWGAGYDELMGYPADQLTNEYVFPLYSNTSLNTQLRVGNTGTVAADVDVYVGSTKLNDTSYNIPVGGSLRLDYPAIEKGPLRVVSNTSEATILATERIIYESTGYDELMGYPADQLRTEYLFPWYNNNAMISSVTIGVP